MNNKGNAIFGIFIIIGVILSFLIGLGLFAYVTNMTNTALMSVEGDVGQVDFQDAVEKTWGKFNTGFINALNWWGIALIFGLFFGLIAVAYFTRDKKPLLFFILDIFLIYLAFLLAGYIADVYETLIMIDEFSTIFVQEMNLASKLMLNLPIITTIFGAIIMIISYIGLPKTSEEQIAGY